MSEPKIPDWRMMTISALSVLLLLVGGFYFNSLDAALLALRNDQSVMNQNIKSLSERTTTLEESKRNQEQLLKEMKLDLEEIKRLLRND